MIKWHFNFTTADVTFLFTALIMQLLFAWPGLGLFYCGMWSRHDVIRLCRYLPYLLASMSLAWVLWAFSLAFAPGPGTVPENAGNKPIRTLAEMMEDDVKDETGQQGRGGVVGGNDFFLLNSLSPVAGSQRPVFSSRRPFHHVPNLQFMTFQMMLFVTAPTPLLLLLIGRIRPSLILGFAVLWGSIVYSPIVHWIWGDGWLESIGAVDSGGGLIHIGVGFSALAVALVLKGSQSNESDHATLIPRQNIVGLSVANGGMLAYWIATTICHSALTMHADGRAVTAFINSHLAAAAGVFGAVVAAILVRGKTDQTDPSLGALAGLVAIAPGSAFVFPQTAIMTGAIASAICCVVAEWLRACQKGREASLIFVAQGLAGCIGFVLVGVFSTSAVGGRRWDGRIIEGYIEGNLLQIGHQILGLAATAGWAFIASFILLLLLIPLGLRTPVTSSPVDA